ncbi:MAG: diacylglycerol kinase family protein [Coriobacteriia bacterium]|nr:diacylglycerol kinase family protein [Coriobacteriia bacterium]MCL2870695.1 diacylglycerol kinase family protein [Coriobacteriia bacterium]
MARQSIFKSWAVSMTGFFAAVRTERNVALVCFFAVLAIVLSAVFRIPLAEWIIVIFCCGLVLTVELVNTAIESVTDLACNNEIHPLAKIAKDTASAATLVASVTSLIVALLIFTPRVLALL